MSFAIVWNPVPAEKVDVEWDRAELSVQEEIEKALVSLHRSLSIDPLGVGESREADFDRVLTEPPVTLHYRVIERMNLVRVYAATVFGSR